EYRSRYRTRRELRGRDSSEVLAHLRTWVEKLDKNDPRYEHHLLEGLWVSWGMNRVDHPLLHRLLQAHDYRVRAAAVRVVRYTSHQVSDYKDLLKRAAADEHGRVRLEALVAASWLEKEAGLEVLEEVAKNPLDDWMADAFRAASARLNGDVLANEKEKTTTATNLEGRDLELYKKGQLLYAKDGFCVTCHQADGKGLPGSGFPPLAASPWLDNDDRLIKLTLHG